MAHSGLRPFSSKGTAAVFIIVFVNRAGSGKTAGQAIALYVDADDAYFENCIIKGHQDTLFLAPLPPKELQPGGFLGPKEFTPRIDRRVYFKNCRIEGGVDFIFGGANAVFEDCDLVSVESGYVFAPSTPEHVKTGFVAKKSRFLKADGVADGSCYIARPWREYARVTIEDCFLDTHISSEGFADWNGRGAGGTVVFEERNSTGPGVSDTKRPEWVKSR